ncbi:glutathione transferase [Massilia sp. TS11]|uniref:glutathione transferase n=1 Tax=Massilia sp. TS11 TaxID=2908003 RepID=UPI001EDAAC5D|nr:glutathione transferase [Massilia sp. TS11]MCG2585192.1 glutathione transferase [Massilia sp. TS11]
MSKFALYVDSRFLSPYAMSAFVALIEKGLTFELHPVNLEVGEHKAAPYQALSLTGRVPTLVHGALVLNESSAIGEYLDESFPTGSALLPRDLAERAQARQVMAWIRSDLLALRQERPTDVVFLRPTSKPLSEAGQQAAAKLIAAAERLVQGPQLFSQWCLADLDLAVALNRLIKNGDPVPEKLADYAAAQWRRPSVQEWLKHVP